MPDEVCTYRLLTDGGSASIVTVVAHCDNQQKVLPLTSDEESRKAAINARPIWGRIDRETFMHPGTHLFADAVFNSEQRIVRPIDSAALSTGISTPYSSPPLDRACLSIPGPDRGI